ncbi:MAG: DNA-3-methyladenine glycosylase [archaeon GW2011_AR19]|nr:MAG: DNA-3-methyladenine glycosylase [archaeon GW2011_AR19]
MGLSKKFFSKPADFVAKFLLGKVLCREMGKRILKARIVETEAYFGEDDPASWARYGKRKSNILMWDFPGKILIKNVHKYKMLNFITGKKGEASAILIRALEPLNFRARCSGPGLITECLKINKAFNGQEIIKNKKIWIEESNKKEKLEIFRDFRVGVKNDLKKKLRFYIKGNKYVSRK